MSKNKAKKKSSPVVKATAKSTLPAWLTNRVLHCAILFFVSCAIYVATLGHGYALDDAIVITDNEYTQQGIAGMDEILKYDTFRGFFKEEGKDKLVSGGRYRPMTLLMFAVEYKMFGGKPWIGHLMNVILYGILCVVLYLVLLKLFLSKGDEAQAYFVAFAGALLFAAHPIHTEVVANIKGRDEIMTLLGSLGALLFALKSFETKQVKWMLLAGLTFFIGLLSKENAITFLAVVPLAFFIFTKASVEDILVQTMPILVATILFLAIRSSVLGWDFGEPSRELMNNPFLKLEGNRYVDFTFMEKMARIFYTLIDYVKLQIFPHPLTHDYYPLQVDVRSFANPKALLSLLFHFGIGIYALVRLPKKDPIAFGIIFYIATLSIVSNIFFPIGTNMGERFIFMPSVGFCLIVAVLLYRLSQKVSNRNIGLGVVMGIALLFAGKSFVRSLVWKDNLTLFTTDVEISTNSAKANLEAGGELVTKSIEPEFASKKNKMLQDAVVYLNRSIKIHPGFKNAHLLLGNAHNYLKQFDQSIQSYKNALSLDPNYQEANSNLAITYQNAGRYWGEEKGNLQKALQNLQSAYQMKPNEYETLRLLGVAYGIAQDHSKAIDFFTKATKAKPSEAGAFYNLGSAYHNAKDIEKGVFYHNKAKQMNPNIEEDMKKGQ